MAFQRIRIKNSNVAGKVPGADKLDTAELCINLKDQKLFSKDADGNVFELGGGKVESGPTPPSNGNETGDLFWDGDFLLVWNGTEWVPVGQSDLDYTPAADGGTITNTNGDDAELPLVDETNAGLMSPEDFKKLGDMPVIISGDTFPGTPSVGDIWFDTSDCPPTLNIWDDCDDPGNPVWKPIGGGGAGGCQQAPVQIIGDSELGSTLTATGGNGADEGTGLTATYEWTGAKTGTGSTIVADVEGDYTVTATITCTDGSTLSTSSTKTVSDSYVDMVNNTPPVIAVVGEGPDGAYEGNSLYVVTPATVINGDTPVIVENQWYRDGANPVTGQLYLIDAADAVGTVVTCRQLFRDARTNEILSDASNGVTIVARPADAITFAAVITDDGTPNANTPGHDLTASAQNIVGGTAPSEYEYNWLVGGQTMGTNKILNIIPSFVGQVVSCEVTVAEPDGSNPETRTAVYDKVIEVAGAINTPEVLAPADGAGDGSQRYLKSDTIIEVEGGGVDACETDAIESVSGTAPNITLTFPTNKDFDCFELGEVVQDPDVKIISKDAEAVPPTITVDGGEWGVPFENATINSTMYWEDQCTGAEPFPNDYPLSKTFDGVTSGTYESGSRSDADGFTFFPLKSDGSKFTPTTVKLYAYVAGGKTSYPDLITVNGVGYNPNDTGAATVREITVNLNGAELDTINWQYLSSSAYCYLKGIEIDGQLLVSPDGPTTLVKETAYDTKLTVDSAKDLADMTGATVMTDGAGAPGPYSQTPYKLVTTEIESIDDTDPANVVLTFPGAVSTNPDLQYFKAGDVVQTTPDDVTVISTGYAQNSNTMVVDGGTWAQGDTVEYQTNGGEGTIVSVNTDDNTLLISNTGDRDNRWIAENKAGTDFYVAGPSVTDEPLLTADVRLESSLFATTPADADTLKNIVWELNGAEQNAGTTNPYTPTGLALNTTYTVRVKHQGNALEDSAWSTSTTFTTGATRNLYTYYKERVQQLEARIAGIEADEIVDDANDVTLLTAFANLVERVEALENP